MPRPTTRPPKDAAKDDDKKEKPKPVAIDIDGLDARVVRAAAQGRQLQQPAPRCRARCCYRRLPRTGSGEEKASIVYYDLEEREEKTVLEGADAFIPTADGKKLFVLADKKFGFVEVKEKQKIEKALRTSELEATVDPKAEWSQMFADAFRFERDFFYDPGLHGVDWPALRDALPGAHRRGGDALGRQLRARRVHRRAERVAHLSRRRRPREAVGARRRPARRRLGARERRLSHHAHRRRRELGRRRALAAARSRRQREARATTCSPSTASPLRTDQDPLAAFQGLADKTAILTVNGTPSLTGARQVTVRCLGDDTQMRFREWIEPRRARVDKATNGRVGYIYVQSTGVDAQNELMKQFMAQWRKDALIIDERFNSGGQIPDRFIELLNRPMLAYWAVRQGEDWQWPPIAHRGPKVMLINGWSGSGGDAFPFYFREAKIGPLVGTRTWGGLIGLSGSPELIDGGGFTVPTFRMYDVRGKWFAEGVGVEPDIRVDENPTELAKGNDPQLERAIAETLNAAEDGAPGAGTSEVRASRAAGGSGSHADGEPPSASGETGAASPRRRRRPWPPSSRRRASAGSRGRGTSRRSAPATCRAGCRRDR